jgi:hypothetical protein
MLFHAVVLLLFLSDYKFRFVPLESCLLIIIAAISRSKQFVTHLRLLVVNVLAHVVLLDRPAFI